MGHVSVLDAWRGIAILLVLGVHSDRLLVGGWLGVHLFFVLSGFLITALLVDEHRRTGRVDIVSFYRRRALRLLPALLAMLCVYVGLTSLRATLGGGAMEPALLGAVFGGTYVVNIVMALAGPDAVPYELHHLWSLGVEEQFYIVWPVVLVSLAFVRLAGPWVVAALLVAVVIATGAAYDFTSIVVGCIAGALFSYGVVRRIPVWIATSAAVPMVVLAVSIDHSYHATPPILLFTIPTAIVLVASALSSSWWLPRLVDRRILRWFGRISYGLYLWHWPVYVALGWKLGLPVAVAAAALSYRFVERPFLDRKRRLHPARFSDPAPGLVAKPAEAVA